MFKKFIASVFIFASISSAQPALATSHAKTLSNLGMDEIMFAQSMIPHHEQALQLAQLALKNSTNKEVIALSKSIISSQGKEITQIKYWLKATNSPLSMGHDMGMAGMLSQRQITQLGKLKGPKFDKSFLQSMVAHHQGALEMVILLKNTKNAEAKKLASDVVKAQSAEISSMKKMISKLA